MARVCVALSGGVDSAAAAALLLQAGHQVEAITMETGYLSVEGALAVAEHLSIPIRVIDLRQRFEELVVRPTAEHYRRLSTPNPCAWCNLRLKFGLLLEMALEKADIYATGHYACWKNGLRESVAPDTPSQAYFLALVPKKRLKQVVFPLCNRSRGYAEGVVRELNIPVQGGKSQDLCFLPPGGLPRFLEERGVPNPPGRVVDTSGRVLGEHRGIHLYTLGQRRGVGTGGTSERRYVVDELFRLLSLENKLLKIAFFDKLDAEQKRTLEREIMRIRAEIERLKPKISAEEFRRIQEMADALS